MHTPLAQAAHKNLSRYEKYCTPEEFKELEKGVKEFDVDLTRSGYNSRQARTKLNWIKDLDFKTFTGVMFAYFGKKPTEYINNSTRASIKL